MASFILLDRDGVINRDRENYVYRPEHLVILPGVPEAIRHLHEEGFGIAVITNQAGIAKGLYTREDMHKCHELIQEACAGLIQHFYYSPWHPVITESLSRKPGSLMFEKAKARFKFNSGKSWMIGDKDRDLKPAKSLGIQTIQVIREDSDNADFFASDLPQAAEIILNLTKRA
jgi:D-glycero-D-manno-heptose 1,7-bisphosphate phosphatase